MLAGRQQLHLQWVYVLWIFKSLLCCFWVREQLEGVLSPSNYHVLVERDLTGVDEGHCKDFKVGEYINPYKQCINSLEIWEPFVYYDANGSIGSISYNGVRYAFLKNLQGDVVAILDTNSNIVARYTYDAWGKVLSVTDANGNANTSSTFIGNVNPIRYRGYYYDTETGWYYLNSRYYDPQVKRFINADGIIGANGTFMGYGAWGRRILW